MKTHRFTCLATVVVSLAAFSTAVCAEKEKAPDTPLPPGKEAVAEIDPAAARWKDIKDLTYDQREKFFAGFKLLVTQVDDQITELTAKRAAMPSTAYTKDWDFAMKEMVNARTYLLGTGKVLGTVSPENWPQQKDRVGQAWVRSQDAYKKVLASTTA